MNKQKGMSGRNDGSQVPKNKKASLRRLWFYLSYYKKILIIGIILTIIANILSLIGPYLTGKLINEMWIAQETSELNITVFMTLTIMMISFYLISAVMNYFLSIAMVKISQSVVYKIRTDLFNKMTKVSVGYFDSNTTGDIITRMSYDVDSIATSLSADLMSIITSSITLVVSFIMMLLVSPLLLLIYFITIPISFIITKSLSKIIKQRLRKRNAQLGIMNGFAEEMITAQKTIQSYVQEDNVYNKFQEMNKETQQKSYEAGYYSTIVGPSVNFINNLGTAIVGTSGAILVVLGKIMIGDLSSFILYSKKFSGPINQISNLVADIQSALAAAERIFYVIDQDDEKKDIDLAKNRGITNGLIEFDNVSFGYNNNQMVLKDVSFTAKPGQTIAIVGHTGSGKTTLVNLLMRYYEINSGKILLDGISIDEFARSYYRRSFSMVLQDTWVFKGTVYENIAYGNNGVTMDDVVDAAKKARIHHYISTLEKGYETVLSDEGVNISKGQKQLLVIARAFLSKSQILILDEATSNVDTFTEIHIQEAMKDLMKNKTSFVIAHRLSTIKNADQIILLEKGEVKEIGSHSFLIENKKEYYELFMSQYS